MKLAFNESLQLEINNMLENYKKGEYEIARDSALLITKKLSLIYYMIKIIVYIKRLKLNKLEKKL